jgi:hypothetical protein
MEYVVLFHFEILIHKNIIMYVVFFLGLRTALINILIIIVINNCCPPPVHIFICRLYISQWTGNQIHHRMFEICFVCRCIIEIRHYRQNNNSTLWQKGWFIFLYVNSPYLILPLVLPDVRVSLIFTGLFHVLDLSISFSVQRNWTRRFWLRIIPFTEFGHTDFDYRYLKWGSRRVWPVSRACLLLLGTWSYLRICRRSVLPHTWFCNCLLITITIDTL